MKEKILYDSGIADLSPFLQKAKKFISIILLIAVAMGILSSAMSGEADYIEGWIPAFIIPLVTLVLSGGAVLAIYIIFKGTHLVVTDRRVYGVVSLSRRVDLPLDSISAVALSSFLTGGISVSTSSGRISFYFIPEREKVHKTISDLLINRQKAKDSATITQEVPLSNADELKKYKDLLDSGVITQEEFDAKKKQLLGL